jgi:hypothetical protein
MADLMAGNVLGVSGGVRSDIVVQSKPLLVG